ALSRSARYFSPAPASIGGTSQETKLPGSSTLSMNSCAEILPPATSPPPVLVRRRQPIPTRTRGRLCARSCDKPHISSPSLQGRLSAEGFLPRDRPADAQDRSLVDARGDHTEHRDGGDHQNDGADDLQRCGHPCRDTQR